MNTEKEVIEKVGKLAEQELSPLYKDKDGKNLGFIDSLRNAGFSEEQIKILGRFIRYYQWIGFSQGENHIKTEFKKLFGLNDEI